MKRINIGTRYVFALAMFCGMTGVAQGNILVNPGFETGDLTGWDEPVVNNNPWSVLGFARTGSHSAYSAPMPTAGPSNLYQSFDPVPVDQITEAGYWYFHMGGTGSVGSAVTLTFDDATQVQDTLFAADPEYVQFQWAYRDLTPTLSGYTDKSLTQISFFTGVNKAKYIDDVVISVPEPSVLALIGLGTLAMLPRRRASRG